jgi:phosphoserine phosphatase
MGHDGFRRIWFDCDSTISTIEGIDELGALRPGAAAEIAELTRRAMAGEIPLGAVYGRRLELIRPTQREVAAVGRRYAETLVPWAAEVVAALKSLGKEIGIVSGGLRPAVLGAARAVGVRAEDVLAVDLAFDASGNYAGFDRGSPLARTGGKTEILAALRQPGLRTALVGDGATDAEAASAVDLFIGFGGVVVREAVKRAAPVYLEGASLAPLLLVLATAEERVRLAADPLFAPVVAAAEAGRASLHRNAT